MSAAWDWFVGVFGLGVAPDKALEEQRRKIDQLVRRVRREYTRSQQAEASYMGKTRRAQTASIDRVHIRQYVRAAVLQQQTQATLARYLERLEQMKTTTTVVATQVAMQTIAGDIDRVLRRAAARQPRVEFAQRMANMGKQREELNLTTEAVDDAFEHDDADDDVDADDIDSITDRLMEQLDTASTLRMQETLAPTAADSAATAGVRHRHLLLNGNDPGLL